MKSEKDKFINRQANGSIVAILIVGILMWTKFDWMIGVSSILSLWVLNPIVVTQIISK